MTSVRIADVRLLTDLIDRRRLVDASIDGGARALTDGTTSLTWGEYADQVARLAGVIVELGVRPGDRVAVRLPKSCDSFVSVHAVLRAGGVVVPLDPLAPVSLVASVIADADAHVMITDRRSAASVAEFPGVRGLVLPGVASLSDADRADGVTFVARPQIDASTPVDAAVVAPSDPAYIIFTSGSTGTPKGIVHSHASALAYARAAVTEYELDEYDRLANIAPLHFDQSTFELYAAPLAGAMVLTVPDPVLRFPASLSDLIAREQITVWYSVPYLLEQLSIRGTLDDRDLSSLRWVLYGGESFPPSALATLMHQLPHARFSNVYGPAEVNQCTAHHLGRPPEGPVPIGPAWRAARIRLLDPDDHAHEVDPGEVGVIAVATPTMMTGYWNRADLTDAATLVDDDGTRWYVTGDLGRADPDGVLDFLGRVDHQVKVRGHRIELEAIDALLRECAGVSAATVVVDRPTAADDRLVALVVGEGPQDVSPDEIAGLLRSRLPRYAVPAEIRVVEALPRTATGKIDRTAAHALVDHPERHESSRPTDEPRFPT
ncbi:amino acid adenylation domain-containing protein [Ilumatobacter sp.]|uniref:amino acid adenylation domain-containing protein n=1 Tax=Ilumatobacter sp. TaxID=1967498 RepID=UPI003AF52F83